MSCQPLPDITSTPVSHSGLLLGPQPNFLSLTSLSKTPAFFFKKKSQNNFYLNFRVGRLGVLRCQPLFNADLIIE